MIFEKTYSLSYLEWKSAQEIHSKKVDEKLSKFLTNRGLQKKHPVFDFLFEYYSFRPGLLSRWTPGLKSVLESKTESSLPQFTSNWIQIDNNLWKLSVEDFKPTRLNGLERTLTLLKNSSSQKPFLGCNGMHEWAMVYGENYSRYEWLPFRLSQKSINVFVEDHPIRCSHYDAFRFFTPEARPLNKLQPELNKTPEFEQPGCLHTNMDLYKWAYKYYPWVSSDLIWACFELSWEIRKVDMQASPYDLSEFGVIPICIETENGQREYRERQNAFYHTAKPLRAALITELELLKSEVDSVLYSI